MEEDNDQSDGNNDEMTGLGSRSPPDSDCLDNPYMLETIKLQEMFFFRDNVLQRNILFIKI